MMIISILAALAASAAPAPDEETERSEQKDLDRVVCERSMTTGTRLGRRVCMTVAEWEHVRRESSANLKEYLRDTEHLRQQSQAAPTTDGAGVPR